MFKFKLWHILGGYWICNLEVPGSNPPPLPSGRTWTNICSLSGYVSLVKTGTRCIIPVDESLSFEIHLEHCPTSDSSFGQIIRLVPGTSCKCMPKFVQMDNACSAVIHLPASPVSQTNKFPKKKHKLSFACVHSDRASDRMQQCRTANFAIICIRIIRAFFHIKQKKIEPY